MERHGDEAAAHAARMRRVRYGAAGGVALAVGAFTALAATSGPATQAAPVAASGASSPVAGTPSAASPSS